MVFEQQFTFLLVVFCLYAAFWHWFFHWFSLFFIWFFAKWFSLSNHCHFRSSIFSLFIEISLNCMSGLVRLYFLFRQQDFCYDQLSSQSPLQICFVFICSYSFNWIACVNITLYRNCFFFSIAWSNVWSHVTYLLSKRTSSLWNWLFFILFQRDKVKWVCAALTEGYARAANIINRKWNILKIQQLSILKIFFFGLFLSPSFWDCRSTKPLRLLSGNLPAMLWLLKIIELNQCKDYDGTEFLKLSSKNSKT